MRIAILTCHRAHNCGAMLQAWALKTVLNRMGHEVEFPCCNNVGHRPRFWIQDIPKGKKGLSWLRSFVGRLALDVRDCGNRLDSVNLYNAFRRHYLPEIKCEACRFDRYFDCAIIGSDQVWNDEIMHEAMPLLLGESLPPGFRRIAYAASAGDVEPESGFQTRMNRALQKFAAISVREPLLGEVIGRMMHGVCPPVVLDPTLLLKKEDYLPLAIGRIPKKPYLYAYLRDGTRFEVETARALASRLGVPAVISPVYVDGALRNDADMVIDLSPGRMIQYINHAKYVVASSFHGTVFSILFEKPFISLRNQVDVVESRPAALVRMAGLSNRLMNPKASIDEMVKKLVTPIDFAVVGGKIRHNANRSVDWLTQILEEI